jgi:hypothetical protein
MTLLGFKTSQNCDLEITSIDIDLESLSSQNPIFGQSASVDHIQPPLNPSLARKMILRLPHFTNDFTYFCHSSMVSVNTHVATFFALLRNIRRDLKFHFSVPYNLLVANTLPKAHRLGI